jgi:endonuclease/exonuclease/phosphatase family metal-dependent hydrolase
MTKLVKYTLIIINTFVILSLIASLLSVYINPNDLFIFQFFGLIFIFIYSLNFLFFLFWLFIKKKKSMMILNLIFIVIGITYLNDFFRINLSSNEVGDNSFKIISYNVRQFDLYNWEENKINRDKYFEFLKDEDPDIVCFQEYYEDFKKDFVTTDSIIKILKTKNYYFKPSIINAKRYAYGIATFSKYPIINSDFVKFENSSNIIIYTDIIIKNDTIRIFNAHLQSIKFKPEDYKFITKVENSIDSIVIDEAKPVITKMRDAYKLRAVQADTLAQLIKKSPFKVILCGDFNDTPISYTYHKVKSNLNDAFIEAGSGIGQTYNGTFPSFRIDYILYSDEIEAVNFKSPRIPLSDHFPIVSSMKLKNIN